MKHISSASAYLADRLDLSKLPDYAHAIIYSTVACFAVQFLLSPLISGSLFPKYRQLKLQTRRDWDVRAVAFLHAIYASFAAFSLLGDSQVRAVLELDKCFGFHPKAASLFSVTLGYFAWDLIISTVAIRRQGAGFFLHALMCFAVFLQGYKPFLIYFGAVFLLWEVSSIFLNIHWALDKLDLTGSKIQLVNGLVLLSTFFYFRLVYGLHISWTFWKEISRPEVVRALPPGATYISKGALSVLTCLNVYWFHQMIYAIKKRFDGTSPTPIKKAA